MHVELDVPVPMGDGALLRADVYRPTRGRQHPVIMLRTPYSKAATPAACSPFGFDTLAAVRGGYAVVVQDVRGTSASDDASDGRFVKFAHESRDGADSLSWAARQPWSNGRVAMAGYSYLAASQLLAAADRPDGLRAVAPALCPASHYEGLEYLGGAFQLGRSLYYAATMGSALLLRAQQRGQDVSLGREILEWILANPWDAYRVLPLTELPDECPWLLDYGFWLANPDRAGREIETSVNAHYGAIDVPALHVAGWYDVHLKGTLENYRGLRDGARSARARSHQRLVVAPWAHVLPGESVGDIWMGDPARHAATWIHGEHMAFFDTFMRGRPDEGRSRVQIFVMGTNRWRDEDEWPIVRATENRFYLRGDARLTRDPPGDDPPLEFSYDPSDPAPTVGGNTYMFGGSLLAGPRDRSALAERADVLAYASEPLPADLEVTGPITASLHVATSARDTDFTVALTDIHPDGRQFGVADGILRLRYRSSLDKPELAEPGRVYEITVDLVATSNVFRAGNRLGIQISSSNFPRFDRNPNHGGVIAEATAADFVVARQRVFHGADRPSFVALPIVKS